MKKKKVTLSSKVDVLEALRLHELQVERLCVDEQRLAELAVYGKSVNRYYYNLQKNLEVEVLEVYTVK